MPPTYTVKSGDMLAKIARAHATTVKAILAIERHEDDRHQNRPEAEIAGDESRFGGHDARRHFRAGGCHSGARRRDRAQDDGELTAI